jgi:hypothetical protein
MDLERVRANVRQATTEDLLDRATVYREGMEPEALALIDAELRQRGVSTFDVADHGERQRSQVLFAPEGWALKCERCHRPAVGLVWSWHRLLGLLPVFPRRFLYCREHLPAGEKPPAFEPGPAERTGPEGETHFTAG